MGLTHAHQRPQRRWFLLLSLCLPAAGLLGLACGGGSQQAAPKPTEQVATTAAPTSSLPATTTESAPPTSRPADTWLTVRSLGEVAVFAEPDADEPARVLPARNSFRSPLALLVLQTKDGWHQVLLPGRPNGATGWVRSADVATREVDHEVRVDLTNRTLSVVRHGEVVLTTPAVIGDADHPTPTGRFSLTDKLSTGQPNGAYGPYALGISGRSDVLTEFRGGDGQVGIHGTNDPSSIGRPVSHGCIRVPNDVATALTNMLPLGTPVVIS